MDCELEGLRDNGGDGRLGGMGDERGGKRNYGNEVLVW